MRSDLPPSMATAFYFLGATTLADIANTLGRKADAKAFRTLAEKIKAAFNKRFFNPLTKCYDGGVQSAQVWPLAFGLVPETERKTVADYLHRQVSGIQRHLTTGYVSTKFALDVFSAMGRQDLVWQLANATDYPELGVHAPAWPHDHDGILGRWKAVL